jgi:hypothetical protein
MSYYETIAVGNSDPSNCIAGFWGDRGSLEWTEMEENHDLRVSINPIPQIKAEAEVEHVVRVLTSGAATSLLRKRVKTAGVVSPALSKNIPNPAYQNF